MLILFNRKKSYRKYDSDWGNGDVICWTNIYHLLA